MRSAATRLWVDPRIGDVLITIKDRRLVVVSVGRVEVAGSPVPNKVAYEDSDGNITTVEARAWSSLGGQAKSYERGEAPA